MNKKLNKVGTLSKETVLNEEQQSQRNILGNAVANVEPRKSNSSNDLREIMNTAVKQHTVNQSDHRSHRVETRMITVSSD